MNIEVEPSMIDDPRVGVWISVKSGFPPDTNEENNHSWDIWVEDYSMEDDKVYTYREADAFLEKGVWYNDRSESIGGEITHWMHTGGPEEAGPFRSVGRIDTEYNCPFCKAHHEVYLYECKGEGTFMDRNYVSCCCCHAHGPIGNSLNEALEPWIKVAKRNSNYKKRKNDEKC